MALTANELETESIRSNGHDRPTYWEHAAQSLWGAYITGIEREAILFAHAIAGKPSRALEIGCEGGRWSKLLTDLGWKMTCTDVDAEVLKRCQQRLPSASCILVEPSSEQIPCETNSAGLLLCVEVPPVIKSSWFPRESGRVLTAGGLIVGVFFNLASWRGVLAHATAPLRGSYDYFDFPYATWKKGLCSSGFSVIYEKGFCWFPFRRSSNSGLVPACVALERRLGLQRIPKLSPWVVFVARKLRD